MRVGFQGGGLRLIKALPMIRGFTNIFRKDYSVVNIDRLGAFPGEHRGDARRACRIGTG